MGLASVMYFFNVQQLQRNTSMTNSLALQHESSFKLYFLRVKGFNIKVKNMRGN